MKISKQSINSLINEVVIPFERYILDDKALSKYMQDDEIKAKHNIGIAKLAIELIKNPQHAKTYFENGAKAHAELNITVDEMQKYLSIFFNLHKEWCIKNFIIDKNYYDSLVQKFDSVFMQAYKSTQNDEDSFLMFESEDIDEAIEAMHYKDEKKISAMEYASYGEILEDDLHSIMELKDECEHILNMYETITLEYISEMSQELSTLANVLFATHEFKDVGYSLNNFVMELNKIDLDILDTTQKELAYGLLSQMNEDIQNWIERVFVNQDALDIHYGDASFLANIAQFSIMLEHHENDSFEDDFLF